MGRDNIKVIVAVGLAVLATLALVFLLPLLTVTDVTSTVPERDLAAATRAGNDIVTGNAKDFFTLLSPRLKGMNADLFHKMVAFAPKGTPGKPAVSYWVTMVMTGANRQTRVDLLYDYGAGGVFQVQTVFDETDMKLLGAYVNRFPAQAIHANDFRWPTRWNDVRWLMLAVALGFNLFATITFALCAINSDIRWRWRWLWMLMTLAGVMKLEVSWVNLQYAWQILQFAAPPAGFFRIGIYGPWLMSFTLPLGAAVYWMRVRTWARASVDRHVTAF